MNININTGEIRLTIDDDPTRVIKFNPNDIGFAQRFYALIGNFEIKEKEYIEKAIKIDENKELDSLGIPKNTEEFLKLTREICDYVKQQIDLIFGEGTSETVFGDASTIEMFESFFNGIVPFIQQARSEKIEKYKGTKKKQGRVIMK